MASIAARSIRQLTDKCVSLLNIASREASDRIDRIALQTAWFEGQTLRLRLFADVLGVYAGSFRQSADFRLQHRRELKELVSLLLEAVAGNVDLCIRIAESDGRESAQDTGVVQSRIGIKRRHGSSPSPENVRDVSRAAQHSDKRRQKAHGKDTYHQLADVSLRHLSQSLENLGNIRARIEKDIGNLLRFAALLRSQSLLKYIHDERANTYDPESEADLKGNRTESFDEIIQDGIRRQMQTRERNHSQTPRWLQHRLHDLGLRRWKRLCYCKARARERTGTTPAYLVTPPVNTANDDSISQHKPLVLNTAVQGQPTVQNAKSVESGDATSINTGFNPTTKDLEKVPSSVATSVVDEATTLNILPPLHVDRNGLQWEFICPLCRSFESIKAHTRRGFVKKWQQHALLDLAPYACFADDCPTPLRPFQSIADWIRHRESEHALTTWKCDECEPPIVFEMEQEYMHHMTTGLHGLVATGGELCFLASVKATKVADRLAFCLICGSTDGIPDERDDQSHEETRRQASLLRCMARHMEAISLASLPEGLSLVSSAGTEDGNSSVSSASATSGTFQHLRQQIPPADDLLLRVDEWILNVEANDADDLSHGTDGNTVNPIIVIDQSSEPHEEPSRGKEEDGPEHGPQSTMLLVSAAAKGDENTVRNLLDSGVNANTTGALTVASTAGHQNVVRLLLDRGADFKAHIVSSNNNPLTAAASRGYLEIVQMLLDSGADINTTSALHDASASGQLEMVDLLLSKGADINSQTDIFHSTALYYAAAEGQLEIVRILLDRGADISIQGGQYFENALQAAAGGGYLDVLKLLLDTGAKSEPQPGSNRGSALDVAANFNLLEMVEILLDHGADINASTALHTAAGEGHVEMVKLLMLKGADVNAKGGFHGTALQAASNRGQEELVELLLGAGALINTQSGRYGSAIQAAAAQGHQRIVELLIDRGADINAQGGKYGNVLQAAAANDHQEVVELLIGRGVNVNAHGETQGDEQDGKHTNALQAASAYGHVELAKLLLDRGADLSNSNALYSASQNGRVNVVKLLLNYCGTDNVTRNALNDALIVASARGHKDVVRQLLEKGADVNLQPTGDNGTALYAASESGRPEVVQMLLDAGMDVNARGGYYGTALQAAARSNASLPARRKDYLEVLRQLLHAGADVNAQSGEYGNALQAAAKGGHRGAVKMLLDAETDVNAQGGYYSTALLAAIVYNHQSVVKLLLEGGADVNDNHSLHNAANSGHREVVKLLLDYGADVNATSPVGTALHNAASSGHGEVVKLLLDYGADVNATSPVGTALQNAASSGHREVVKLLLDMGADINAKAGKNTSSFDAAWLAGHEEVIKLLLDRGAEVDNCQLLWMASATGDVKVVQLMLDGGADVNARMHSPEHTINSALITGQPLEVQSALIKAGTYHETMMSLGSNALEISSVSGMSEVVKLLLDRGADIHARGFYSNVLYAASANGHQEVVKLLLDRGADVYIRAHPFEQDPFQDAAARGHMEVVKLLLDKGADVNASGPWSSALIAASVNGHPEVAKLLLNRGADVGIMDIKFGDALQAASRNGHPEIVILLIEAGADVNAQPGGEYGSALQAAAAKGHQEVAQLLLDRGAAVEAQGGLHGSAAGAALAGNHQDIVRLLLMRGVTIARTDNGENGGDREVYF